MLRHSPRAKVSAALALLSTLCACLPGTGGVKPLGEQSPNNGNQTTIPTESATQLAVSGATTLTAGNCAGPYSVFLKNSANQVVNAVSDKLISLVVVGNGALYLDSNCSGAVSGLTVSVGTSQANFYFRTTVASTGNQIQASTPSLTASSLGVTVTSATADHLEYVQGNSQTATVGIALSIAPSIRVIDVFGNPVAGINISWIVSGGGGSPSSGTSATSSSGIASVGYTVGVVAGANNQQWRAENTSLAGTPKSLNFSASTTPGAAHHLGFSSTPSGATAGSVLSTQPSISIQDAYGNVITSSTQAITLAPFTNASCTSSGTGTLTVASNPVNAVSGVAAFSGVKYTKSGTLYLSASGAGLPSICSSGINVSTASPSKLTFPGPISLQAGVCAPVQVVLTDTYGNLASVSSARTVNLTGAGSGGFFSSSSCLVSVTSATISASSNSTSFYYKGTIGIAQNLTFTATDSLAVYTSAIASATVTIPPLSLSGPSYALHGGYSSFSASGGVPPYTYAVVVGAGAIDSYGAYTPPWQPGWGRIQVTDNVGTTATKDVTQVAGPIVEGTAWDETINDSVMNSDGSFYVGGYSFGTLYIEPDPDYSHNRHAWFGKIDTNGKLQYLDQFKSGSGNIGITRMGADAAGNIYAGGTSYGSVNGVAGFGSDFDVFVVKYDSTGTRLWTQVIGSAAYETLGDLKVDSAGNIYIIGTTMGSMNGSANAGTQDYFVTKYDTTGTKQWAVQGGGAGNDYGFGLALDSNSGAIYIAGSTNRELESNSASGSKSFLAKLDSTGTRQWVTFPGSVDALATTRVAVDSAGNPYIASTGMNGFSGTTLTGTQDLYLIKYNSAGTLQWSSERANGGAETITDLKIDSNDRIYLAGSTTGAFEGYTSTAGLSDTIFMIYSNDGTMTYARRYGGASSDIANSIAVDIVTGYLYLFGSTYSDWTSAYTGFGPFGSGDNFWFKFDPAGNSVR